MDSQLLVMTNELIRQNTLKSSWLISNVIDTIAEVINSIKRHSMMHLEPMAAKIDPKQPQFIAALRGVGNELWA